MKSKFMSADQVAAPINGGDTLALMGGVGGLMETTCKWKAASTCAASRMP